MSIEPFFVALCFSVSVSFTPTLNLMNGVYVMSVLAACVIIIVAP
uniref:Uncharacterized protein n=1 Tax=Anopheles stephensi TaxID=30069 RepID=A0A182YL10_ANOST